MTPVLPKESEPERPDHGISRQNAVIFPRNFRRVATEWLAALRPAASRRQSYAALDGSNWENVEAKLAGNKLGRRRCCGRTRALPSRQNTRKRSLCKRGRCSGWSRRTVAAGARSSRAGATRRLLLKLQMRLRLR
jgi:hypothetical protein